MKDLIRTVRLHPYRKGQGPTFTLRMWDTGFTQRSGFAASIIAYKLVQHENGQSTVIFDAADFGSSPMHAIDSDNTVAGLLTFLTLRPGDTDADYFADYTDVQREYCEQHAETLAGEVLNRFGGTVGGLRWTLRI